MNVEGGRDKRVRLKGLKDMNEAPAITHNSATAICSVGLVAHAFTRGECHKAVMSHIAVAQSVVQIIL